MYGKKLLSLGALSCCLVGVPMLHADYLTSNRDMETLRINDQPVWDDPDTALYKLFNGYFDGFLENDRDRGGYGSSDELFAARGVKEFIASWNVQDQAQVMAAFKKAQNDHTLYLSHDLSALTPIGSYPGNTETAITGLGGDPYAIGAAGLYTFALAASSTDGLYYSHDITLNDDGLIHMIAFDVTDLVRLLLDDPSVESAYLFGWEDLSYGTGSDFDYQDLAYIMVNVMPISTTPEPGTALILIAGLSGLLALRASRKRLS